MGVLLDKKGNPIEVTGDELVQKLQSGDFVPASETVTVRNAQGDSVALPSDTASRQLKEGGYSGESVGEQAGRAHEAQLEEEFSGAGAGLAAGGLGLARGASLTLSDAALAGLGIVDPETIQNLQRFQPGASLAGEAGGLLGTAWLAGGAGAAARIAGYTPAGMAARGAAVLGAKAGGNTLARAALGLGVEGAVDGALWSGAQSISDAVVNNDPLTVESFLANVGSGAAVGGFAGGLLGAAGKMASRETRVTPKALEGFDDFGKSFAKRIKSDIDNLPGHVTAPPRTGAAGAELSASIRDLQSAMKGKAGSFAPSDLARKAPEEAIAHLQKADRYIKARQAVDSVLGTRHSDDLIDVASLGVPADNLAAIGKMEPEVLAKTLGIAPEKLPQGLSGPSELLFKAYVAERVVAKSSGKGALGSLLDMASTAANIATLGGAGVISSAARRVILQPLQHFASSLRAVQSVKARMADGVQAFAKAAVKPGAGVKAARVANTAFRGVRFAEGRRSRKDKSIAIKTMRELQSAAANPQALRATLDKRFAPLRGINLQLAYEIGERYMQRIDYLNRNLPPLNGPTSPFAKTRGGPSAEEVQKFANRLRASEDPLSLLDDLKSGHINREAVETVKEMYPELFKQMQLGLMQEVSTLQDKGKEMTYQARLQLDMVWDVPLEPTAQPAFLGTVNEMYAMKREQAPAGMPAPSTRAPKLPEATAAQRLENR